MPSSVEERIARATLACREDRYADAYELLLEITALCQTAEERRGVVLALKSLGQLQRDVGRLEAARESYAAAASLCRLLDEPLLLAHTLRHLGDIDREAGQSASARPFCAEALAIYRRHSETRPLDLANAIRSVALLEAEAGSADAAKALWQEAMSLYAAAGVPEGVAECAARLALIGGDDAR